MTDREKMEFYRQALAQIVYENGGSLKLGPLSQDLITRPGSLMNRPTEDGGIEFRHVFDGDPS